MSVPGCDDVRSLIPELALEMVPGAERAAALDHIAGCAACREELDEMAGVADSLLLVGPEGEPPAGFESRVLKRLDLASSTSRWGRRRSWARLAVAGLALVLVGALAGLAVGRRSSTGAPEARVAPMKASIAGWQGTVVAVAASGRPAQTKLFVSATAERQYGTYVIEVVDRDGGLHRYDGVALRDGNVAWSRTIAEPLAGLTRVRMLTASGTVLCQADLTA